MAEMIAITNYKKWANIALIHDPLMEVARLDGKHQGQKDIIKLLKIANDDQVSEHVKLESTESIGMIETLRFKHGDHGFCDFAMSIVLREFYPRGGRLQRLYQRVAYANAMMKHWTLLETHLLKNLEYVYYSQGVWNRLDQLQKKYPVETRKNLLLAIAAFAEMQCRSQIHLEEDDELNEFTSNSDSSDSDDDNNPPPPPRKRALKSSISAATKRKALEVSSPDKAVEKQ